VTDPPSHPSPHDALFKRLVADLDAAGALLRGVLPGEIFARVDWGQLALRSGGYVDEALKGLTSDLVLAAPLGERPVLFYVLVEHQSAPDAKMPARGAM